MCGIVGLIDSGASQEELHLSCSNMATAVSHRGPDGVGFWCEQAVSLILGHRRLAIHDLSALGAQPMISSSGRFIIVFNGEIYNFKAIARSLVQAGCRLKGGSDTEVLLNAVEQWGLSNTLSKCTGMFAFALYDNKDKRLTLARDRLGEKPLYYAINEGRFIFSSELKGIMAAWKGGRPAIDKNALGSYLKYGYISAPRSIYDCVKKVEPGSLVSLELNGADISFDSLQLTQYWSVSDLFQRKETIHWSDKEAAVEELNGILNSVIEEQASSDVPLGTFISGGIDSSAVASILQAQSDKAIDTFSIGFNEEAFNEAVHAKQVAKHIGSNHHELYIDSKDALDLVPHINKIYDEPFADSSQIPMVMVSQLARSQVTVCLSGDGGDELFCGYNRYIYGQSSLTKLQRLPNGVKHPVSKLMKSISPSKFDFLYSLAQKIQSKKGGANFGAKAHKLADLMSHKNKASSYDYLISYWHNPAEVLINLEEEASYDTVHDFETDFLDAAMEWDQKWYLPGDNLVKTDRASMCSGLEVRVPLLDIRVAEFSWSIPNEMKLFSGQSKWILRQVLYKYVPKHLIERPKMGFTVPIGQWIRYELRDWAETLLERNFLKQQGLFNIELIQRTWFEHLSGKYDHSNKLWTVLVFQDWYTSIYNSLRND